MYDSLADSALRTGIRAWILGGSGILGWTPRATRTVLCALVHYAQSPTVFLEGFRMPPQTLTSKSTSQDAARL